MLKLLVNNTLKTSLTIISDNLDCNGDDLISVILHNKSQKIKFISTKLDMKKYAINSLNIDWYDSISNEELLKNCISNSDSNVIVVDSLTPIIWQHGFERTCRLLTSAAEGINNQIVCRIHEDSLLSQKDLYRLMHISTCFIQLLQSNEKRRDSFSATIHFKKGGKLLRQKEFVQINENFLLNSMIEKPVMEVSKTGTCKVNMENLTTFNLGVELNKQEKEAKDNLVLPYLRNQYESNIVYEPDERDYEEDPDEDLEL